MSLFQTRYSFEHRQQEASRVRSKYPDRIPIIVEKMQNANHSDTTVPNIKKNKFLVPSSFTMGELMFSIRKQIKLPSDKAMFIFVQKNLMPNSKMVSSVYEEYKDDDGFVYLTYCGESTFGCVHIK